MVWLELEGASPQHTAASGVNLQGAGMPAPDLETKPWSSSAEDWQDRRDHIRMVGEKSENSLAMTKHTTKKKES